MTQEPAPSGMGVSPMLVIFCQERRLHGRDARATTGPTASRFRRGFSLVELLVVIAIIWVLIALLMPAIITAQRHAYTVQCASNLRQIGMALQSYAGANHGWLPAWSGWHTWPAGLGDDSPGPAWTIELAPYIGNPDSHVYNCTIVRDFAAVTIARI
ncbi:MAG TPA: prepilin-type N-terminal cleavage/methylation domain-containing protein [Tepidisphaeraceae bacterium]|nr:prepilin-type N-terminal cleavage/methylation domain-containing protein [Tepidisphaeraceae bacterium]